MTQRERILGGAVGLLVAGFVVYFVGGWFLGIFTWRAEQIEKLTDQKDQLARDVRMGTAARDELAAFERRSLPGNLEVAKTEYTDWLFALAEKKGLQQVVITPGSNKPVKGIGSTVPIPSSLSDVCRRSSTSCTSSTASTCCTASTR
jgi:hypothetical protein